MRERSSWVWVCVSVLLGLGNLPGAVVAASSAQKGPKGEWEVVVARARKEGKVVIYGGAGIDRLKLYKEHFEAAFAGISVDYVAAGASELAARLMAERRAGKQIADLYISGASSVFRMLKRHNGFQPIRSALVLPEVSDASKWFEGRLLFADDEERYILIFSLAATTNIAVNTQLVNPSQVVSYEQLLDPRWQGKIASQDIRQSGPGSGNVKFVYLNPRLGPAYVKKLYGEMGIALSRDTRQMVDWLGQGRVAFQLFPTLNSIDNARDQGLPVEMINPQQMKEGYAVTAGFNNLLLMNPAPHPNAAKVFINWLLSRDGQTAFESILETPSLRKDTASKGGLRDFLVPKEHGYSMNVSLEKYWDLDAEIRRLVTDAARGQGR